MERENTETKPKVDRELFLSMYEKGERDFRDRVLDGIDLSGCHCESCDLSGSSLIGANLKGADFHGSTFIKSDLSGSNLSRANFSECDLSWARLAGADLTGTDMHRAKARATGFSDALMIRTKLNDADCLGAIMMGINATAAQMESTNFECADLSGATLMNVNLCGANCSWANMSDTRLNWANLSWCQLEAADMENANLTGSCLQAANLSFANLDNVILTGADLYFANLAGTLLPKEMPTARVSSAKLTSQSYTRSQWPKELLRAWQRKGAVILDFESFSRDVQEFIREGDCNLRIYFMRPVEPRTRIALEVLIFHLIHSLNSLRILSVFNTQEHGLVAFYSPNPADIELFTSSLRNKTWHSDISGIEKEFLDYQTTSHIETFDIVEVLDEIANQILQIQELMPVGNEDRTSLYQEKLTPGDKRIERKKQVSWSNISLPRVTR